MHWKLLDQSTERTFALVFDTGDEAVSTLTRFARDQNLSAARFTAIGAFSDVVLGYFDWAKKDYERIPVAEQVEVIALLGDIALKGTEPQVHAHVVVGLRDGTTRGGHLLEAHVRPTLEVMLTEAPAHLRRVHDAETGLALIRVDRSNA
ncbi:MAG TPA: PPC domain-containing DNA-binding protein [Burkholderiales bacterium]|nr:PPC domain-containing DNA-binding protein [Burkholderiales bacterium]